MVSSIVFPSILRTKISQKESFLLNKKIPQKKPTQKAKKHHFVSSKSFNCTYHPPHIDLSYRICLVNNYNSLYKYMFDSLAKNKKKQPRKESIYQNSN
jgi:hypothetical protein